MTAFSSHKGASSLRLSRIALVGFEGAAKVAIEMFVQEAERWLLSPAESADCVVVNADQGVMPAESVAQLYSSLYANRCLLISSVSVVDDAIVCVQRPYNGDQLKLGIEQVLARVGPDAASIDGRREAGELAYSQYRAARDLSEQTMESILNEKEASKRDQQALSHKFKKAKAARERYLKSYAQSKPTLSGVSRSDIKALSGAKTAVAKGVKPAEKAERALPINTVHASSKDVAEKSVSVAKPVQGKPAKQPVSFEVVNEVSKPAPIVETVEPKEQRKPEKPAEVKPVSAKAKLNDEAKSVEAAVQKALAPVISSSVSLGKPTAAKAEEPPVPASKHVLSAMPSSKSKGALNKKVQLNKIAKQRSNKKAVTDASKSRLVEESRRVRLLTDEVDIYRCCGNLPDVNLSDPDERRRIYFDAEGALLNILPMAVKQAHQSNRPTEIIGLHNGLVFQPGSDTFYCEFGEDLLLQYALSRFTFGELSLNENEAWSELLVPANSNNFVGRGDALIWKVALWTSRGRLAYGIDPEKIYNLKFKPDFTRLICFPYAVQISELWHGKSLSVADVVGVLRVPQRYVFAFVVAAKAIGALQA